MVVLEPEYSWGHISVHSVRHRVHELRPMCRYDRLRRLQDRLFDVGGLLLPCKQLGCSKSSTWNLKPQASCVCAQGFSLSRSTTFWHVIAMEMQHLSIFSQYELNAVSSLAQPTSIVMHIFAVVRVRTVAY